ncbi:glucose-1-phosphate adenylyltransferase large subunit, chloroplastic/amyloplastic [Spinacia oleracea]|uniref:Glucose-1-phosphate adenylyltransferase n=1 Tax=Spinacia oleracea TaxID=3562 RepID=A0A9R0JZF8_SPIOL|nr:glucose-1-phosphate adenylyltransferase large subunit, chloroplastic/amyloplastic [Spinacia oleracea]XP_021852788.1 glucose-1-phosphate adenylyltransferase large subunit, chloroplastic/amyloplastic [Spinacia oleracea]XP_021852789.1 glucose-1-phosphate adenylyltransferase large subunit, chloroplastic/amyloplastic [Spinacia oleracea]
MGSAVMNPKNVHISESGMNRFLGERISQNLKNRDLRILFSRNLRMNGNGKRVIKPGIAYSVLTSDFNQSVKESLRFEQTLFETPRADPKDVAAIILGGGAGTRLFPLTGRRAKPAVPIGGCYRLIDVPMSNCINSGIRKIFILTQFNSFSLNRHLARTYNFGDGVNFGDGFVEVFAATQTPGEAGKKWFQGTADAVRQLGLFDDSKSKDIEHIIILSGDHLYRMDYMNFVQKHIDTNADITVSCLPMDDSRASDFGLMKIDHTGRIIQFAEKPKGSDLNAMQVDTTVLGLSSVDAMANPYIASMGVYVFRTEVLMELLNRKYPLSNDFGSEIIPSAVGEYNVQAYLFNDYWEDIGTIKSFFDANLALTEQPPKFQFYDPKTPFYTSARFLPPTKVDKSKIVDSIISHGCFLQECSIEHSIVGIRSRLESGVKFQDTMMMGADYYQTESEIASLLAEGKVPIGVGQNTKIQNCIIDKNAKIGKDVVIANKDGIEEADRPNEGFYIRSGITVILKNATIRDGLVI